MNSWIDVLPQCVSWAIIALGWYVVNHQNNKRETRKEVRQKIDLAISHLTTIEEMALKYHKLPNHDTQLATNIKISIKRFGWRLFILNKLGCDIPATRLAELRQAITLNNFDSSTHMQLVDSHEIILSITSIKDTIELDLEEAYGNKFIAAAN